MRQFGAQQHMSAPACKRHAACNPERIVEPVAFLGDAAVDADLQPFIFLVQHEVDDARDRIRAIGRRCAAGHDLNPLDQRLRDGVDVDQAVDGRGHRTASVEQYQRAFRPQVAQVQRVDPGLAARQVQARVGGLGRSCHRRQLIDEIGDIVRRRRVLDILQRQHGQRRRCLESVASDARAGNGHVTLRHLLLRRKRHVLRRGLRGGGAERRHLLRGCGCCQRGEQGCGADRHRKADQAIGGLDAIIHGSPRYR